MTKAFIYLLVIAGSLSLASCKKDKPEQAPAEIKIRVNNATPWALYDCTLDPTGTLQFQPGPDAHNYGQIGIDSSSYYNTFSLAFRYSWFRLTMNNKVYYLTPFDYIGEKVLASGHYTFKLIYLPAQDRLSLESFKD